MLRLRRTLARTIIVLMVMMLFIGCFGSTAFAETQTTDAKAIQTIDAIIYIVNISKFDITNGTYTVDFYLVLGSNEPITEKTFELNNGNIKSITVDQEYASGGKYSKQFRIMADMTTKIDLRKYPFDTQNLVIKIESPSKQINELKFQPYEKLAGIDPDNNFLGWNVNRWTFTTVEHKYESVGSAFSQLQFNIEISRVVFNAFVKTFLPIIIGLLIVLGSLLLDIENMGSARLSTITSTLLAMALFHIAIYNQLPPLSYMTFADKFMFLTYFVVLICFIVNIVVLHHYSVKRYEIVKKIRRYSTFAVYAIVPILYFILFKFLM